MKILPSALVILASLGTSLATPPQYTARFLGQYTGVSAINASGQVVGTANVPSRAWVAGPEASAVLLPLPSGKISSRANDINDAGVIVGAVSAYSSTDFYPEAATWTPNGAGGYTIQVFGKLPGDIGSMITALNDGGDLVGFSKGGMFRRAVWFNSPGGIMDLTPYGIFDPTGINNSRTLVDSANPTHRFDLDTLTTESLALPVGSYNGTWGYAINESGQVAGNAILATSTSCNVQAARHTDGVGWEILSSCGSSVQASAINDLGDTMWRHALDVYVLLEGEGTFKVQDLITNGVGTWIVVNSYAIDLNNARQLAVWASNDALGQNGTVLLTPTCASVGEIGGVAFGADKSRLNWTALGGTYDVARGELTQVLGGELDCFANDVSTSFIQDAETPAPGETFHYLVRAVDACGAGAWGGDLEATCP